MSPEGRERNRIRMSITISTSLALLCVLIVVMVFFAAGWITGRASNDEDEPAYNRGYFDGFNAGEDFITENRVREGSASKCEAVGYVLQKRKKTLDEIVNNSSGKEPYYEGKRDGYVQALDLISSSEESIRIDLEEKK